MTLLLESDQVGCAIQPSEGPLRSEWWEPADDGLSCTSDPFDDFNEDDFDDDFDDDFEEDWDDDLPTDEDNEVESRHEDRTDDPDFDQ